VASFGDKIRELRLGQEMTVTQLAEAISKTPGYISRIEVRDEIPSPQLISVLARALNADLEMLLRLAKDDYLVKTEAQISSAHERILVLHRKAHKNG